MRMVGLRFAGSAAQKRAAPKIADGECFVKPGVLHMHAQKYTELLREFD
jgi:hypothetical protein